MEFSCETSLIAKNAKTGQRFSQILFASDFYAFGSDVLFLTESVEVWDVGTGSEEKRLQLIDTCATLAA